METPNLPAIRALRPAWNKGRIVGQKRPLKPKHVWAIRVRLELAENHRDLALFNMAIDSKLRGCDLVKVKVVDVMASGQIKERASVLQSKTQKPVRFEISEGTRASVEKWMEDELMVGSEYLWPGRFHERLHISTRQYARIVRDWVTSIGLEASAYVSHRLIRSSGPKDPSGWRLPAPALEALVADLVRRQLNVPAVQANIVTDATTQEVASLAQKMSEVTKGGCSANDETNRILLSLIERVQITPGRIQVSIAAKAIADCLTVDPKRITEEHLSFGSDFRHRKRGVETKLILADAIGPRDETLFKNIALAHRYFDLIRSGKTYSEIAEAEGASKRRVQQLVELAFLAPNIIRDVWEGGQPLGLTSQWLKSHAFTSMWDAQRDLFRAL